MVTIWERSQSSCGRLSQRYMSKCLEDTIQDPDILTTRQYGKTVTVILWKIISKIHVKMVKYTIQDPDILTTRQYGKTATIILWKIISKIHVKMSGGVRVCRVDSRSRHPNH
uniref:(northern house mosquito) hypothetical protein n=1 Tax=Culex pipiens TaxID=7175 RepID=A0A8D8FLD6_CULPI